MAVIPYEDKKYQESQNVVQAHQALQQHQANQPGQYQSQYQPQMTNLMNQYQNRGKFQYDLNADALYQQAAQRYIQQGQQAMMDTMGQAAMLTGGYGNSYAQNAGQQAYHGWLQGLHDQIPQYYNMALQQYQMEGDDMLNRYNMLANAEAQEYGRYMDNMNQYYQQLDRLQGVYDSERNYDYSKFEADRNFDYGRYQDDLGWQYKADRDAVADQQWADQWAYQQERDKIKDQQWQTEFDENMRRWNLQWEASQEGGGGGGGGRGGGGGGGGGGGDEDDANEVYKKYVNTGYGSQATIAGMKAAGYSQTAIEKAKENYQKTVSDSLKKVVNTRSGTM